ncbi:MAG: hypothetical protein LBJ86_07555, partial [Spirochaetaceae bacterium]|nr:hypothetical protein [Spirochaetaceae bacterium]
MIYQDKEFARKAALAAGFTGAGIISPFEPDALRRKNLFSAPLVSRNRAGNTESLLVCALPYGNTGQPCLGNTGQPCLGSAESPADSCLGVIAPFARFNYYREAVKRMKKLSRLLRVRYGGEKR